MYLYIASRDDIDEKYRRIADFCTYAISNNNFKLKTSTVRALLARYNILYRNKLGGYYYIYENVSQVKEIIKKFARLEEEFNAKICCDIWPEDKWVYPSDGNKENNHFWKKWKTSSEKCIVSFINRLDIDNKYKLFGYIQNHY